jgi:ribulose bisphosphate carboxylase small subunit
MPSGRWLLLCPLVLAACGKVGEPQPPFIRIPEAVEDLAVSQTGYNLVLSWTNPPRFIDGSAATNLAHVQIRANGELMTTVDTGLAGKPQSYVIPIDPGTSDERTFTVVVETRQGKVSDVSKEVSIKPVEVPGKVQHLLATPDQRRIFLTWEKPQDHPDLADVYIVTRTDSPADSQTVTETRFEDDRYKAGETLTYQVIALRKVGGGVVTGLGPESTTVAVQDKTPPKAPVGISVTTSETGAIVTWDPNDETDLAGYRVYRSEQADGGFKLVTDVLLARNSFFDASYRPDIYYSVTAVDEFKNESPMSTAFRAP